MKGYPNGKLITCTKNPWSPQVYRAIALLFSPGRESAFLSLESALEQKILYLSNFPFRGHYQITLHSAPEASVRFIWDTNGNCSGIWNFGVKATKNIKLKKIRRDLHHWSCNFRSILEKTRSAINFMAI